MLLSWIAKKTLLTQQSEYTHSLSKCILSKSCTWLIFSYNVMKTSSFKLIHSTIINLQTQDYEQKYPSFSSWHTKSNRQSHFYLSISISKTHVHTYLLSLKLKHRGKKGKTHMMLSMVLNFTALHPLVCHCTHLTVSQVSLKPHCDDVQSWPHHLSRCPSLKTGTCLLCCSNKSFELHFLQS